MNLWWMIFIIDGVAETISSYFFKILEVPVSILKVPVLSGEHTILVCSQLVSVEIFSVVLTDIIFRVSESIVIT